MRIKTIVTTYNRGSEHDDEVNAFLEKLEEANIKVIRVIPHAFERQGWVNLVTTIIYDGSTIS
jgi:hypothetical protein